MYEKFKFFLNIIGSPNESTLTRKINDDCTMLTGTQKNIDWARSHLNYMLKSYYRIDENLKKGAKKPYRFVEGEKILFARIFEEPIHTYNRRSKKENEKEDKTYYGKLDKRREKTQKEYEALPKGKRKEDLRRRIFHISRDIQLTIGDKEHSPTKEQMDSFSEEYLRWFEQRFTQMPVFMCVVTYDDLQKKVLQPPTVHICILPLVYNKPESRRKRKIEIGWNRCLAQSLNGTLSKATFIQFRDVLLSAADKIAKEHGFCRERPRGYSNLKE